MAKRVNRPGGGPRKASGTRKPKIPPPITPMIGDNSPYPPRAEEAHSDGKLTYSQEKFVHEYLKANGNATAAYHQVFGGDRVLAGYLAHRMMKVPQVIEAIEAERERFRQQSRFSFEKYLHHLIQIVDAEMDDFTEVLAHPRRKESYRGLVGKRGLALKKVNEGEFGNSVELYSRMEALIEIRKALGFKAKSDSSDERDVTGSALEAARRVLRGGKA